MEQGYTLKHLNDLTIVFSEIRRLIQADNNLSKHLQKEINLYYLFEIYHRYLPAMYSNIKKVDLINQQIVHYRFLRKYHFHLQIFQFYIS